MIEITDATVARFLDALGVPIKYRPEYETKRVRAALEVALTPQQPPPPPPETKAEKIARLHREIGTRQLELQYLVLGDPTKAFIGTASNQTPEQPS